MTATPNLNMDYLVQGQALGEVTHNDALNDLDVLSVLVIEDRDLTAPPGSPNNGEAWIPTATATGAWAGQEDDIAYWFDAWLFLTPYEGMRCWIKDEDVWFVYDGTNWLPYSRIRTKAMSILTPGASEDATFFFTDRAITVVQFRAVNVAGTTPSVTFQGKHHTDRSNAGNNLTNSTVLTNTTTGADATLSDATVPADSWIWIVTTASSGSPTETAFYCEYTEDP